MEPGARLQCGGPIFLEFHLPPLWYLRFWASRRRNKPRNWSPKPLSVNLKMAQTPPSVLQSHHSSGHIRAGIRSSNCTFTTTCLRSMCVVLTFAHIQWLPTIKCTILITCTCRSVMWEIMNLQMLKNYATSSVIVFDQYVHINDETASLMIFDY